MKPTHKAVCSCENGEYSAIALGFASGSDQIRKKLGLRVSSNPVEKANDILVSNRQKQNGMSWSPDGSTSLATLTALRRNGEDGYWLLHHDLRFQFDAATHMPAA